MVLIYLHGFRSLGNSGKTLILKELFPEYKVIGPSYTPHDPELAEKELTQLVNSITDKQNILVIGTSLGGFWAHWMAKQFNLKAIMINPSIDPGNSLKAGTYTLFDQANTPIKVTAQALKCAANYKVEKAQAKKLTCFVWVALDDEVLDPGLIINELKDVHSLTVFEHGSHRFTQFDQMKPEIEKIIALD